MTHEGLPQFGDVANIIDDFSPRLKNGFLSNFYVSTIYVDKKPFPTVEHAYQSYKTLDESARELIRKSKTPADAKKLGRCVALRPDWDNVKISLMKSFLKQKFENPFLSHKLLETGDAELIHKNTWNDRFWGVCRGVGENWLGRLLMEVREELKTSKTKELE